MADLTIKDYQDWLKNNKSVKVAKEGEELSKYDEQKNRALYQEYLNEAQLYNDKKTKEALIDQNKRDALRDNYIVQAQAQKNAGDVMKAAKMTTGLSESSLVDLYARGAQARADIMKQSAAKKVDLLSKYNQSIVDVKASTNSKFAEIDALRYQDEEAKKADKDATDKLYASSHFADLLTKFNNDEIDFEELQGAYETLGVHFDDIENYDIINEYQKHAKDAEFAKKAKEIPLKDEGYDVNVWSADYKSDAFGKYLDTGKTDSKQEKYIEAIVEDAKNGKIPVGAIITANYGYNDGTYEAGKLYKYIGDGKFKIISTNNPYTGAFEDTLYDFTEDLYVPDGYEYIDNGWDKFWGTRRVVKK